MTFRCENCQLEFEDDTQCSFCGANLMPPRTPEPSGLTDLKESTATASTSDQGALAVADRSKA